MEKKNTLILDKEFILYCELNGIKDIDKIAKETFNKGFAILKYGETPVGSTTVKEKIVEVIKEVPVEVIVEKEKSKTIIKEVPVEIIKEVINTEEVNRLREENEKLKKELDNINESLNKLNKAKYMKNSDLNSLYGE